ncbi:hypothetical protein [Aquimarina sp. 2201CG14-23]|uniref:hypothetical protein n=1 Tax=Aquimarina mycalae TaxID=3040073 RepID=UPI0024781B8E|nr:hypothetical protein [Aquimarina sp. 2201CG14-23]MDH7448218.1 hypothetical protein [Aquimarina sp. 2201CG14-23]
MRAAIIDSLQCIDIIDKKVDDNEILKCFQGLSEHHDSEIKLYKSDIKKYIISFNWKGIDQWKIDCPVELNKIHKQGYATEDQSIAIIKEIYEKGNVDHIPGFIDVPIRHFTLDEMLQFKKEDDMMLKGEDPDDLSDTNLPKSTISTGSSNPKKDKEPSLVMGAQLGDSENKNRTPTPSKIKTTPNTVKKSKPATNDNSLFSI